MEHSLLGHENYSHIERKSLALNTAIDIASMRSEAKIDDGL